MCMCILYACACARACVCVCVEHAEQEFGDFEHIMKSNLKWFGSCVFGMKFDENETEHVDSCVHTISTPI